MLSGSWTHFKILIKNSKLRNKIHIQFKILLKQIFDIKFQISLKINFFFKDKYQTKVKKEITEKKAKIKKKIFRIIYHQKKFLYKTQDGIIS